MDTSNAIATLTALLNTARNTAKGWTDQADSIQIALNQLNGILNTPSVDLQNAQQALATKTAEVTALDADFAAKTAEVEALKVQVADAIAQVEALIAAQTPPA